MVFSLNKPFQLKTKANLTPLTRLGPKLSNSTGSSPLSFPARSAAAAQLARAGEPETAQPAQTAPSHSHRTGLLRTRAARPAGLLQPAPRRPPPWVTNRRFPLPPLRLASLGRASSAFRRSPPPPAPAAAPSPRRDKRRKPPHHFSLPHARSTLSPRERKPDRGALMLPRRAQARPSHHGRSLASGPPPNPSTGL